MKWCAVECIKVHSILPKKTFCWIQEENQPSRLTSPAGNARRFLSTANEQRANLASYVRAGRLPPAGYAASIALIEGAAMDAAARAQTETAELANRQARLRAEEEAYRKRVRASHTKR